MLDGESEREKAERDSPHIPNSTVRRTSDERLRILGVPSTAREFANMAAESWKKDEDVGKRSDRQSYKRG